METSGGSAACENSEPLTSPATGMPTGFVRCSDGFIHREEVVAIPSVQTPPNSSCGGDLDDCMTDADCNGGSPDGLARCVKLVGCSWFCGCVGSCEVDNDCGPGRACVGAEFTGDVPRCVPAGCSDSSECGEGLCGISVMKAEDDWHPTIELACMTDSSACRMDNCTLSDMPNASSLGRANLPGGGRAMDLRRSGRRLRLGGAGLRQRWASAIYISAGRHIQIAMRRGWGMRLSCPGRGTPGMVAAC